MTIDAVFELPVPIWVMTELLDATYASGYANLKFNVAMPTGEGPDGGPPAMIDLQRVELRLRALELTPRPLGRLERGAGSFRVALRGDRGDFGGARFSGRRLVRAAQCIELRLRELDGLTALPQ